MPAIRLLSLVEALTVTGPIKPIIAFSPLASAGLPGHPPFLQKLLTTRRRIFENDPLKLATEKVGLECILVPERQLMDPSVLGHIAGIIRHFQPNIIESHNCKSHFLLYLLRLLYSDIRAKSWIAFHHGYTRTSLRVSAYQQLDRLTLRHADHVVTVCQPFARQLATRGVAHTSLTVISNPVVPRPFPKSADTSACRAALGIRPNEFVLLSIGRLSSEKGHIYLIRAFGQLLQELPQYPLKLLLVGTGPEHERLTRAAEPFLDKVLFVGHVSDPWDIYHSSDIFVLPSLTEGSPLVLLEAMSAKLPIVSTCVGGVPESVTNGVSALLVPPKDPVAIASALRALLADESLRRTVAHAALERAAKHAPETYAYKLMSVYERLL